MNLTKISNRNKVLPILKLLVFGLSCWLLYREVLGNSRFQQQALDILNGAIRFNITWLIPVIILLIANWAIETRKWQILLKGISDISFLKAYKAILTGVFVSFFTPNRMGEFAGRILYLKKQRVEASFLTMAGSLSQLICTVVIGLLALVFTLPTYSMEGLLYGSAFLILLAALLFFYLNIDRLVPVIRYLGLPKKWYRFFIPIRRLRAKQLWSVLAYSFIRYLVFSVQFYFMFKALDLSIPFLHAIQGLAIMFLIQSLIPSLAFLEITGRAMAAHYAFQLSPEQEPILLVATYSIWVINLFIPGMVGAILFLLNRKEDVEL